MLFIILEYLKFIELSPDSITALNRMALIGIVIPSLITFPFISMINQQYKAGNKAEHLPFLEDMFIRFRWYLTVGLFVFGGWGVLSGLLWVFHKMVVIRRHTTT